MAAYGTMDTAILGMPYGLEFTTESYPASVAVTPGMPMYMTPGTFTVHQTPVSGDSFIGVALAEQRGSKTTVGYYEQYDVVNILTKGLIYMKAGASITGPDRVYASDAGLVYPTTSGYYDIGATARTTQTTVSGLILVEIGGIVTDLAAASS